MLTRTDIEKYFLAEKQLSLWLMIIGILAAIIALVFFLFLRTPAYKGAAIPLLLLGLIELFIGWGIYKRSDPDRIRNVYAYGMDPQQLKQQELPRLQKAQTSIKTFITIEWLAIAAGLALIIFCWPKPEKLFWLGFGIALALQASIMLAVEYTASARLTVYKQNLEVFLNKP